MEGLRPRRDEGFTLIELLVVIMIIAILAAIAIPLYFRNREKAWTAQIQSALKNAATAAEAWAVDNGGDFSALDGQDASALQPQGFKVPIWAQSPGYFTIEASGTRYCLQAQHKDLSPTNDWRRSTYDSSVGKPESLPDTCPNL
jgi:prepilin-type N-terminal cleavage/methylation domain-containing protein